jgi:2,3-bisphosphoglycerate-dependent phosphoglycerate mutase
VSAVSADIRIVFETHATSEDNERGVATGWLPGRLSTLGREQAKELGVRRRNDGLAAVFSSDLRRAVETAELAFEGTAVPLLLDWRLRECDYGERNGGERSRHLATRNDHLDVPYPGGGESWREAIARVGRFLEDLPTRWAGERVLLIGHVATRWALDHLLRGSPLESLVGEDFAWQEGWEYTLPVSA